MSTNLDDDLETLATEGNMYIDLEEYSKAIDVFKIAIRKMPKPIEEYHSYVWFVVGIGDALVLDFKFDDSLVWWNRAIYFGGIGNPFIHFRRGQTLYETGKYEEASNELLKTLILDGTSLFDSEDGKYKEFILSRAKPPVGYNSWQSWDGAEEGSEMHDWVLDIGQYKFTPEQLH